MVKTTNEGCPANVLRDPSEGETIQLVGPQSALLFALEQGDLRDVRQALFHIPTSKRKSVLLTSSKHPVHQLRTPLMAAAATGDVVIFGTVLEGVNRLFQAEKGIDDKKTRAKLQKERDLAMQAQFQLIDIDGANLVMIAASTANVAVFNAVTCTREMARKILTKQDVRGMTYLMYAINPEAVGICPSPEASKMHATEEVPRKLQSPSRTLSNRRMHTFSPSIASSTCGGGLSKCAARLGGDDQNNGLETHAATHWVPVVKRVLEYARECLWMPEYLRLLQMRDCWDRSIIEHAIVSGRHAIFDAVFEIIRQDVYDEEIEQMMEVGEDSEYEQTAIRVALNSEGGKKMEDLVSGKIRHLKRDVMFRVESSTVTSKIQSFIPGNLIVIFHVLLPEIRENSLAPLILLVLLCCIAPFWAWGASLVLKTYPERQNTLARVTWARHLLACPSMFFWGVGTSTIGQHSFGWNESMCAAALAVATVLIPAIDSFAAGTGARAFYGTIFVKVLGLYDAANGKLQSRFKTQWCDLDVIQPEVASSDITPTGRASISPERSPRLHWPAHTMKIGSE